MISPALLDRLRQRLAAESAVAVWGSTYAATERPANYAGRVHANRLAYRDYLIERESAATYATNGFMLSPAAKAKGMDPGAFFDPNTNRRPGKRWMSPELRSWLSDPDAVASDNSNGGPLLTFTRWRALTEPKREKS